jgi:hypothetical protein
MRNVRYRYATMRLRTLPVVPAEPEAALDGHDGRGFRNKISKYHTILLPPTNSQPAQVRPPPRGGPGQDDN